MISAARAGRGRGVIERYRAYLPVSDETPVVSLGEGGTPLIPAPAWVSYWSEQVHIVTSKPEVRQRLTESLIDESDTSTEAFKAEIASERRTWSEVILAANIRVDG